MYLEFPRGKRGGADRRVLFLRKERLILFLVYFVRIGLHLKLCLLYLDLKSLCTLFFIQREVRFHFFHTEISNSPGIICRKGHPYHSSAGPFCPKSNVHIRVGLFLGFLSYITFHESSSLLLPQIHNLSFTKGLDYQESKYKHKEHSSLNTFLHALIWSCKCNTY